MTDYKGPKTYFEFSMWHGKRSFKTERIGQAFFNDFGFQTEKSYYCEDPYDTFSMLTDALAEKFPEFWGGL